DGSVEGAGQTEVGLGTRAGRAVERREAALTRDAAVGVQGEEEIGASLVRSIDAGLEVVIDVDPTVAVEVAAGLVDLSVALAGQDDALAAGLEPVAQAARDVEHELLLDQARDRAGSSALEAAVPGVDDDRRAPSPRLRVCGPTTDPAGLPRLGGRGGEERGLVGQDAGLLGAGAPEREGDPPGPGPGHARPPLGHPT